MTMSPGGSLSSRLSGSMMGTERVQYRSLKSLGNLQLVWNRRGGGSSSLRVAELVDALAGLQSQVCVWARNAPKTRNTFFFSTILHR